MSTSDAGSRLQSLCGCCWPSRKDAQPPDAAKRPELYEIALFKQFTNNEVDVQTVEILRPNGRPVELPQIKITSSSSSQLTVSDEDSIDEPPFVTARTSRSTDTRLFRTMPELVEGDPRGDARDELRRGGGPEKPALMAAPPAALEEEPEDRGFFLCAPTRVFRFPRRLLPLIASSPTSIVIENPAPLRPLVGRLQVTTARLNERAHHLVYFVHWCVVFGLQKVFGGAEEQDDRV
ncbi:hypothetical protein M3Y99_00960800 [Aphelenchoides fujianensis]|nr:hypothetical protein M3Y99_00960800 [Aphelenchoides fujianensis]